MPRVNPNKSFEVAASHLFRHLHEPQHLKDNPIVRNNFRDPCSGRYLRTQDDEGLARVHDLVRKVAEQCRQADLQAGEDERAYRHGKIVSSNLLEKQPIPDLARVLGISVRQCYRDRSEICERIARRIRNEASRPEPVVEPVLDEFELRMRFGHLKAEMGDVDDALCIYKEVAERSAFAEHKIVAACEMAMLMAWSGNPKCASDAFEDAQKLFAEESSELRDSKTQAAHAFVGLARATLARSTGGFSQALEILNETRLRLEPIESLATNYLKECYVRILVACSSNSVWHSGDFPSSIANISKAQAVLSWIEAPPPYLSLEVELRMCRRRNDMVMDSRVWRPTRERFRTLAAAFDRAKSLGSLSLSLYATICLADFHASAGDELGLFNDIRYAVALLKQVPTQGYFKSMPYDLAEILLRTRYWEFAPQIIASAEGSSVEGATHPELLDYAKAYCHLRAGAYNNAWNVVRAQRSGDLSPHVVARMQVVGAASAAAIGKASQAHALIETAVDFLERFGNASDQREAYSVASQVTGDPRFRRAADEIGSALGAENVPVANPIPFAI